MQGTIINSNHHQYQVGVILGSGTSGKVYSAIRAAGQLTVALKIQTTMGEDEEQFIKKFIQEQHTFKHIGNKWYVVMEQANQGNLFDYIQHQKQTGLDKFELSIVMAQICAGVKEIHNHNLIHRDLKPENILLVQDDQQNYIYKICDLGSIKHVDAGRMTINVGTPYYQAPELIQNPDGNYNQSADIWALGAMLFELNCGKTLFQGNQISVIQQQIMEYKMDQSRIRQQIQNSQLSYDQQKILIRMIDPIPHNRPLINDVITWFPLPSQQQTLKKLVPKVNTTPIKLQSQNTNRLNQTEYNPNQSSAPAILPFHKVPSQPQIPVNPPQILNNSGLNINQTIQMQPTWQSGSKQGERMDINKTLNNLTINNTNPQISQYQSAIKPINIQKQLQGNRNPHNQSQQINLNNKTNNNTYNEIVGNSQIGQIGQPIKESEQQANPIIVVIPKNVTITQQNQPRDSTQQYLSSMFNENQIINYSGAKHSSELLSLIWQTVVSVPIQVSRDDINILIT